MRFTFTILVCLAGAAVAAEPSPKSDAPAKPPPPEPVAAADLDTAIRRGVAFLVASQNADGSWGGPERTKSLNIMASVPGSHRAFQTGTTALAVAGLIDVGLDSAEAKQALDRGEAWLMEHLPKLRRASPEELYNVWGHGYGILALTKMHARLPDDTERKRKIEALIRTQFDMLTRFESVDGGWGYYDFKIGAAHPATDSCSFVNAAILLAFHAAKEIGVEPPEKIIKRAVAATERQRLPGESYLYGEYLKYQPARGINRPPGSLGRSQACNLALRLWGDKTITDEVITTWLDRLIVRNGWLSNVRKRPIPHEGQFQVAGYFYYFGHYYAALCIGDLPPAVRPFYQDHLARLIMPLQEADGSWWDYPLYNYHQPYGTGFALMTLVKCRKK
ncbi:MAG TPA: hypothetical protein VGI99_02420 [Gemmataceae bacterium]